MGRRPWMACCIGHWLMLAATAAFAAETQWWVVDTAAEMLGGKGDGVAVTTGGELRAEPGWRSAVDFEEPVVLASAQMLNGDLVVATGHPARLYRVARGSAELLADLHGEQATSVFVDDDNTIWVATVAPGALFRWRAKGGLEDVARLESGGLWDLSEFEGAIVAAGGPPATLYRVEDGALRRWVELPDSFIRTMVVRGEAIVAGTSGKGLIVRIDAQGRPLLLADSPFTEISDIVVGPSGDLYATALVGEPPPSQQKSSGAGGATNGDGSVTVQTDGAPGLELDLPKVNGKTATSEVFRLTDEGALLQVRRFPKQVASALTASADGVLVGTGYEGEVWFFNDDGGARLATINAVQVVGFSADGNELLTQGPAAVFRRTGRSERPHRFRVQAKNFSRPVRFGEYRVLPDDSGAKIRFRTGSTAGPDPLWMPWTEFSDASTGAVDIEFGKALQWEVEIPAGGQVERVEVASREINLAPVVKSLAVEPPGVIYLMSPPPSGPVIRQDHPTFEGMFSTVGDGTRANGNNKGKKFYQVGYRTVGWKASDANGDALLFDLDLERSDGVVLPVRRRLKDDRLGVDTRAVPDGRYRFRLTASDHEVNPGSGLHDRATSEWFQVDNTAPSLTVEREDGRWQLTVRDDSPVAKVEVSENGEQWQALEPQDGVLDGTVERFEWSGTAGGAELVVFRAFDRHHNSASTGVER